MLKFSVITVHLNNKYSLQNTIESIIKDGNAKGKAQAHKARLTVPICHQGAEPFVVALKGL